MIVNQTGGDELDVSLRIGADIVIGFCLFCAGGVIGFLLCTVML